MVVRANEIPLTNREVADAALRFGIERVEKIGGFENLLFRSARPTGRILRLTHTSRRPVALVTAEVEFMTHLASNGVPVATPIPTTDGALVAELATAAGDELILTCMTEAGGSHVSRRDWKEEWIDNYGGVVGAMHRAARDFDPGPSRRPPWTDPVFEVGMGAAAEVDPAFFERTIEIHTAARGHPAGGNDLLIHQDAHPGNLLVTGDGRMTVLDFDDSAYGTATHDIAIVIFYWLLGFPGDPAPATRRFVTHFLNGYRRHTQLPTDWPAGADLFLSHREAEIFWLLSTENPDDMSSAEQRFMTDRRARILDGVPFLGTSLADIL